MKLTKPLLFLTSTIIGAVSVGSTSIALTKHKPSQTERDVITLDDPENIEEKEIDPDKAPETKPPSGSSQQQSQGGGGGDTDTGSEGENGDGEQQDAGATVNDDDDEDEEEDEDEDQDDSSNQNQQQPQPPSPPEQNPDQTDQENKESTKEEIKESLIKIIKSLSEKKDFSLETAGLYLLFQTSNEVAQLKSLIEQYQKLDQKDKEAAASGTGKQGSPGTSPGVSAGGAAGSPGVSGDAGSGSVGNGAGTPPSQSADGA